MMTISLFRRPSKGFKNKYSKSLKALKILDLIPFTMLILKIPNASTLFFVLVMKTSHYLFFKFSVTLVGQRCNLSLQRAKFTSEVASDHQPTTPKPLNKYLNLKAQTSKLLLGISVTTTIPTTSECTLNAQIAPKPCSFNQII